MRFDIGNHVDFFAGTNGHVIFRSAGGTLGHIRKSRAPPGAMEYGS